MNRKLIWGIIFVVLPVVAVIIYVGYHYFVVSHQTMSAVAERYDMRGFGITIDHPPKGFIDRNAQLLVGLGICFSSICLGVAKIIKALRTA